MPVHAEPIAIGGRDEYKYKVDEFVSAWGLEAAQLMSQGRWEESTSTGDESWLDFGRHWCPAGLLSALIVCAAAHAHSARVALGEDEEKDPGWNVDWPRALGSWPKLLPQNCESQQACVPYLEALLAYPVFLRAAPCLEDSPWPLTNEEVHENVIRWTRWLWIGGAKTPPPRWRGPSADKRIRSALSFEAAGAFAAPRRGAPGDRTAASALLNKVARSWDPSQTLSFRKMSVRQQHFETIFGDLGRTWRIGARGPLGVHTKAHADDFKGPRSWLRFYIYDLPVSAHREALSQLHGRIREAARTPAICDFGVSPCVEMREGGAFSGYRPYAAEATFLAKLLSGPDEVIVDDPNKASYFIVPFLSSTWCFIGAPKTWVRCGDQDPLSHLLPLLTYFNQSTIHRHIFLGTDSVGNLPVNFQMQPLLLHYGPTPCGPGQGPLITPPPLADDLPAPGRWEFSSKDLLLFTADGVGQRPFRREVLEELLRWQHSLPHLFVVSKRDQQGNSSPACATCCNTPLAPEWNHQIRRALFCPVLPGDNTFRMRLFHAVLAGCLPVVMLFPGGSWYRNHGPPVEWSLPFPSQVDWRGFSIELPYDPAREDLDTWAKRLVPTLLRQGLRI
ncbi:Hypothetical protein SCF082_LOCUS4916 [Durusdinium trenchii]|uniref:Exostosin GT47 domain-containing protein n=1 Tax=Durusdinium trenchii TaxID=1381693 RepID=A0ABP0I296_9DINO